MSELIPSLAAARRFEPQFETLRDWVADLAALEVTPPVGKSTAFGPPEGQPGASAAIAELRDVIRDRGSALELTERALRRLEEAEPRLNAFITVDERGAPARAREIDAELERGVDRGPLAGIPIAVKDALASNGLPTSGGCSALRDYHAPAVSPLVEELDRAGAVLIGKTNLNEFGWGLDEQIGRVNNPRDSSRTAGGSSGGSAAAVGAGVVPLAIGTDSGGSVRLPAAYCGVVGFTPTHGLLSAAGPFGGGSLGTAGLLTGSVADAALAFSALGHGDVLDRDPGVLRVGVLTGALETRDPEVSAALDRLIGRLADEGAAIGDTLIPSLRHWTAPWMATFMAEKRELSDTWFPPDVEPVTSHDVAAAIALGAAVPAWAYVRAQRFREMLRAEVDAALVGFDVLLSPTVDHLAPADEPEWGDPDYFGGMRWTAPFNLTGHPAVAIPLEDANRLPASVQLIGRRGSDLGLLAIGTEIETAVETRPEGARQPADR
jgi:aspartyl-tRNA(Asn)/glutamyl-tRNA(Gln) amidotransferase subunit A